MNASNLFVISQCALVSGNVYAAAGRNHGAAVWFAFAALAMVVFIILERREPRP